MKEEGKKGELILHNDGGAVVAVELKSSGLVAGPVEQWLKLWGIWVTCADEGNELKRHGRRDTAGFSKV